MDRKTHPRLKPYSVLTEAEKNKYREPITDAIKTLTALNWRMEQTDPGQAAAARAARPDGGRSISDYQPQPVDMSSLTLGKPLQQKTCSNED